MDRLPVTLTEDLEAHAVYDVPITSISVSESEEIEAGRSTTLKVTCKPDDYNHSDAVIWASSDKSIATVDENGKVTGVSEGEAVITAALAEDASITASCTVTVIPFSSNEAVATVENGTITALAPGNTEIQIIHGEYTAVYQLTVKVPLTSVSLSDTELELNVEDASQLQLAI